MRPFHPDFWRKLGRIRFDRDVIERDPQRYMDFMGRCIVLRAEYLGYNNQIEYVICCETLDAVGRHCMVPEYEVKFLPENNGWEFVPLTQHRRGERG
jgi:hypothetical protein